MTDTEEKKRAGIIARNAAIARIDAEILAAQFKKAAAEMRAALVGDPLTHERLEPLMRNVGDCYERAADAITVIGVAWETLELEARGDE